MTSGVDPLLQTILDSLSTPLYVVLSSIQYQVPVDLGCPSHRMWSPVPLTPGLPLWLSPSPPSPSAPESQSVLELWDSHTLQTGGLTPTVPRHQMIRVIPQDPEGIGQMPWAWDSKKTCSSTQRVHTGILRTPGIPQSCPSGHSRVQEG